MSDEIKAQITAVGTITAEVNKVTEIVNADTLNRKTSNEIIEDALTAVAEGYYNKDEVDNKVVGIYRFKGSVPTYDDLPTTGQQVGDVWDVLDTDKNYAWTGTEWDNLGGISFGGGKEIGEIFPWPFEGTPPTGSLYLDIVERQRGDYSELWALASKEPQLKTDEEYLAMINEYGFCPYFSSGDGVDTFRTPTQPLNESGATVKASVRFNAYGGTVTILKSFNIASVTRNAPGDYTITFLKPMEDVNYCVAGIVSPGNGRFIALYGGVYNNTSGGMGERDTSSFRICTANGTFMDLDDINIIVVNNDSEAPFMYPWYIRAYGTAVNPEQIDITEALNKIDGLLDSIGFTYIYPNGGTEESPATVSNNQRYVMANPYPGYEVGCIAEIYYDGKWCDPRMFTTTYSNTDRGYGLAVTTLQPDDTIILQTGSHTIAYNSNFTGNGFGRNDLTAVTSAPCRVKVFKIGGVKSRAIDKFINKETVIIYPNDGTAASPANVTANSRYVEENPFPGYYVLCEAQIYKDDIWCQTGFIVYGTAGGYGVSANHVTPDDTIVVQTGSSRINSYPSFAGNAFANNLELTTAPCRVIVTRLGAIG